MAAFGLFPTGRRPNGTPSRPNRTTLDAIRTQHRPKQPVSTVKRSHTHVGVRFDPCSVCPKSYSRSQAVEQPEEQQHTKRVVPPSGWQWERAKPAELRKGWMARTPDGVWGHIADVFSGGAPGGPLARLVRVWVRPSEGPAVLLTVKPSETIMTAKPLPDDIA